jgi:hypothetical protein
MFAQVTARKKKGDFNWLTATARTDALGNFAYDTLWEGDYQLSVTGAAFPYWTDQWYKAGQAGPIELKITPDPQFNLRLADSSGP